MDRLAFCKALNNRILATISFASKNTNGCNEHDEAVEPFNTAQQVLVGHPREDSPAEPPETKAMQT